MSCGVLISFLIFFCLFCLGCRLVCRTYQRSGRSRDEIRSSAWPILDGPGPQATALRQRWEHRQGYRKEDLQECFQVRERMFSAHFLCHWPMCTLILVHPLIHPCLQNQTLAHRSPHTHTRPSYLLTIAHRKGPSKEAKQFCNDINAFIGMFNSMLQVQCVVLMVLITIVQWILTYSACCGSGHRFWDCKPQV